MLSNGEHTDQGLQELRFNAGHIDGLRAAGAIPHVWHLVATTAGGGQ
jgi:hypothetical protein